MGRRTEPDIREQYSLSVVDSHLALSRERDNALWRLATNGTPTRSAWRRLVCAARGHALEPALPAAPLQCRYCARVWSWEQFFSGHLPRSSQRSQQAYDDWRVEDSTEIPPQYL